MAPGLTKEFLDIQATIERGFTLKRVRDTIWTYRQGVHFTIIYIVDFEQELWNSAYATCYATAYNVLNYHRILVNNHF